MKAARVKGMVSFSTTSSTGPGLTSSAWQRWCEGAWNGPHAVPSSMPSVCTYTGTPALQRTTDGSRALRAQGSAQIHEAGSRSRSSRSLLLETDVTGARLPLRSACTRQRVSSVCHRAALCRLNEQIVRESCTGAV